MDANGDTPSTLSTQTGGTQMVNPSLLPSAAPSMAPSGRATPTEAATILGANDPTASQTNLMDGAQQYLAQAARMRTTPLPQPVPPHQPKDLSAQLGNGPEKPPLPQGLANMSYRPNLKPPPKSTDPARTLTGSSPHPRNSGSVSGKRSPHHHQGDPCLLRQDGCRKRPWECHRHPTHTHIRRQWAP